MARSRAMVGVTPAEYARWYGQHTQGFADGSVAVPINPPAQLNPYGTSLPIDAWRSQHPTLDPRIPNWGPQARVGAAPKLPNLPKWRGPDENGFWMHENEPRVTWRLHAFPMPTPPGQPAGSYGGSMWVWQWWSKPLKAWVNRFHWGIPGKWFVTPLGASPSPSAKFGIIPAPIYPPINPPQFAPQPQQWW